MIWFYGYDIILLIISLLINDIINKKHYFIYGKCLYIRQNGGLNNKEASPLFIFIERQYAHTNYVVMYAQ